MEDADGIRCAEEDAKETANREKKDSEMCIVSLTRTFLLIVSEDWKGSQLFGCVFLTVFDRGDTVLFPEGLGKVGLGGKAYGGRDRGNGVIRIPKKCAGHIQPFVVQVLNRRLPGIFGKGMCHVVFIHMCQISQSV